MTAKTYMAILGAGIGASMMLRADQVQLPTTVEDFFQPGMQPSPEGMQAWEVGFMSCSNCHEFEDDDAPDIETAPFNNWAASLMAQSARDPVWQAALTIANQDAAGAGEYCIRCHAPMGWGDGRSTDGDLDQLWDPDDFDGVSCNFCHRMVDPVASTENPPEDTDILQMLIDGGTYPDPAHPGNGRYIFDPTDSRRGPRDDITINMHGASQILYSPHHSEASQCAACHDLANPVFSWSETTKSFELNAHDAAHPTQDVYDMFPEQRTYSEWLNSEFATTGVHFPDGRFGGDAHPDGYMRSCQDCHMPKTHGANCAFWYNPEIGTRDDLPLHTFVGGNTWVLGAVKDLGNPDWTGLTDENVALAEARTVEMLQAASDMDVSQNGSMLDVRVTNWSGHKLPTGFPDGRRMWLNVQYLDAEGDVVEEYGAYDWVNAQLDTFDTKVWEAHLGITQAVADAVGLPAGETHHLVLANTILFDNRIPPKGFTNAAYQAIRAAPVGATYADDQHWDDTAFDIPGDASQAIVTMYFQTTTREYMEHLRDDNYTDDLGQIAWDAYVAQGMSAPVVMDATVIELESFDVPGDVNGDGVVNVSDVLALLATWGPCGSCDEDLDGDGIVGVNDLLLVLKHWS